MSEISFNLRKKDAHLRKHRPIRLDTSKHYFFANSNMSNMRRNKQNIPEKGRSGKRECSPHGKNHTQRWIVYGARHLKHCGMREQ